MQTKHYLILLTLIGAIGAQITGLDHGWRDAITPAFVGPTLVLVASNLAALFTDAPRAADARTRANDPK